MPAPTRPELTRLTTSQSETVRLAQRELGRLWEEIADLPPARQRDILLDMLPAIVDKYGDLSSTAAADWYQTLWDRYFNGQFEALPATSVSSDDTLRRIIRAKAGMLWDTGNGADVEGFLAFANGFLDRNIRQTSRSTITMNVRRDPRKPRYARIPSGVSACPFCLMLASRGAVYRSAETAAGETHDYHDDCHCQPAPEWGRNGLDNIEGYDPDLYEQVYRDARNALEHPDSMSEELRAKVMASSPYTVNLTQRNGRIRHHTYDTADPNNLNALALVMKAQHPELFT